MEEFVKVESDHVHLMRGGDILVHCMWIENIMIDLIILKKHPRIIGRFNQPLPYKIPRTMSKERSIYWQKNFWQIRDEFFKLFSPSKEIRKKIEKINFLRNALAHSCISLGRKYFLYRPSNRKKLRESGVYFDLRKIPDQSKPIILKIDYSNEQNYFRDFKIIQSLDQEYFSNEANNLGVIYSHIR